MRTRLCLCLCMLFFLCLMACSGSDDNAAQAPQGIPVKAITVKRADTPVDKQYTGQTAGYREIQVRAQVSGILLKRFYNEGDKVTQGQSLFLIDPAPYQADLLRAEGTLKQAQANLKNAQLDYNRTIPLYQQNAVSQKVRDTAVATLDSSKADVQAAEAEVRIAKINLGYTQVYAPITGMSSKEAMSEGSLTVAGDASSSLLTTITQYDPVYINFSPSNTDMFVFRKNLHLGLMTIPKDGINVIVYMPDGKVYEQTGKVDFMDSQVDPNTGTVRMRAILPNPHNLLYPGQYVKVKLVGTILKQAIVVPQRCVLMTQQGPMVWVVDKDNKVKSQLVEMGMTIENNVVIDKGLEDGQVIVVEGINKMSNGALVTILPDNDKAAQPGGSAGPANGGDQAQPAASGASGDKAAGQGN